MVGASFRSKLFAGVVGALIVALALALLSCTPSKPPAASAPYPALGTVVSLAGGRVRATGVVVRYPYLGGPWGNDDGWVLCASLGSETTSAGIIAVLDSLDPRPSRNETDPLAPFEGRLVTVEGTMTPASHFLRSSSPWPQLYVASIATAPPETQARVIWEGALVQPGRWFDEPWRYNLARAYRIVASSSGGYYDYAEAEKAFGSHIPGPLSPRAGRLVGVVLGDVQRDGRPRTWRLIYGSGLIIHGPLGGVQGRKAFVAYDADWILAAEKPPGLSRLARVNGRPAVIGEMNELGAVSRFLTFWDGKQVVVIDFNASARGLAPTDQELLEIGESMRSR